MIELTPNQSAALRALCDAGTAGLLLSAVGLSTACRLASFEFVTIAKAQPQRVFVTRAGRAHLFRSVH